LPVIWPVQLRSVEPASFAQRSEVISNDRVERRKFLRLAVSVGAAAGGGLLVGFTAAQGDRSQPGARPPPDAFQPNAFIRIDTDGAITLVMPKVEMGQGTYTAHAMLLAEELEVSLDQVRLEASPPSDELYGDPLNDGIQATGTSTSIQYGWEPLRRAGAAARTLLIQAAARRWHVKFDSCQARQGTVLHRGSGRRLSYGQLVSSAARERAPDTVPLKDSRDFTLIGTSAKRLDSPAKVDGSALYGIDIVLPGMKFAAVCSCPSFGGALDSVDEAAALGVSGVRRIVRLDDAVAVIADNTWAALQGLKVLRPQWTSGPHPALSSADLWRDLQDASARSGAMALNRGDTEKALTGATRRLEATYRQPFLAHAAMEPMNCTVVCDAGHCAIWVGTQVPSMAQAAVAKLTGLPVEKVAIHNQLIGGGFGRRLEVDYVVLATRIAQQVDHAIKVTWSREEDMRHALYRPMYQDRLAAGLGADGRPVSWIHRICGSSVTARYAPADMKDGVDPDAVEGSIDSPYELPNIRVEFVQQEPRNIPTAWWRGVGPTRSTFVVESFIDELAALAKIDAIAYRRALLDNAPRAKAVLDLAAHRSTWGAPLRRDQGRGVSLMNGFGSFLCAVVEITMMNGIVRIDRVTCAVDCGVIVNPNIVRAQIEGGVIFGLTAALFGEITIRDGRVRQGNFNDYRLMRIDEAPKIEVHLAPSGEKPGGIGETGTAVIAAALTNAIFAATGQRIRELPIRRV
jgi:CO/xanthine dehydrogenase Mo-binding subunit